MFLTIETTHQPATDLGFLLHQKTDTLNSQEQPYGFVHTWFPVATSERCQAAVFIDVNPVSLIRNSKQIAQHSWALGQYVNDRPYAVSSLLCVVINREFGQALRGKSHERPDLAQTAIPLKACIGAVVSPEGPGLITSLFEPLGYNVEVVEHPLDAKFPQWGAGVVFTVTLEACCTLSRLLSHLYVLIPVLDNDKHYWVTEQEIDKLMLRGKDWLEEHPQRELITRRYLKHQRGLTRLALARLTEDDDPDPATTEQRKAETESHLEAPLNLRDQRLAAVMRVLAESGAKRVLDLGCGEGALLKELLAVPAFTTITGVDVSAQALSSAERRLGLRQLPPRQKERISLLHGSLAYADDRFKGYDAAVLMEVIEHLDPPRLAALELNVFGQARPGLVVVTTPNAEYNKHFNRLEPGLLRHPDHRFEWTRGEFEEWAARVAEQYGYQVAFTPIGDVHESDGAPTQLGVFKR